MSAKSVDCFECEYDFCETDPNVRICRNAFIVNIVFIL